MGENNSKKEKVEKKKLSLGMQIFIALILAIIAGLLMQNVSEFAETYIKPFGTIFLNLVKFVVCPIVLFSDHPALYFRGRYWRKLFQSL